MKSLGSIASRTRGGTDDVGAGLRQISWEGSMTRLAVARGVFAALLIITAERLRSSHRAIRGTGASALQPDPAFLAPVKARIAAAQDTIVGDVFGSATHPREGQGFQRKLVRFPGQRSNAACGRPVGSPNNLLQEPHAY